MTPACYQDQLTRLRLLRVALAAAPPDRPVTTVTNGALAEAIGAVEAELAAVESIATVLREFDIPSPASLRQTLRRLLPAVEELKRERREARAERDSALKKLAELTASRARPVARLDPRSGHRHDFFIVYTYDPTPEIEHSKFNVIACVECGALACMPHHNYAAAPPDFRDRFEADMRDKGYHWSAS